MIRSMLIRNNASAIVSTMNHTILISGRLRTMKQIGRAMTRTTRQLRTRSTRHSLFNNCLMSSMKIKMKRMVFHMTLLLCKSARLLNINIMRGRSNTRCNAFSRSLHTSRIRVPIRMGIINVKGINTISGSSSVRISRYLPFRYHHGFKCFRSNIPNDTEGSSPYEY